MVEGPAYEVQGAAPGERTRKILVTWLPYPRCTLAPRHTSHYCETPCIRNLVQNFGKQKFFFNVQTLF